MTEDVIDRYDTCITKGFPDELIFGYFNLQPIPSDYYNFLMNDNENGNNIPEILVDNDLPDNKGVEDVVR